MIKFATMDLFSQHQFFYVAYTKPRSEELARNELTKQGFQVYLPYIYLSGKTKNHIVKPSPFFPRYLFFVPNREGLRLMSAKYTYGVSGIVSFGEELAKVSSEALRSIQSLENKQSQSLGAGPEKVLTHGSSIVITEGPFAGLEGIVDKCSSKRVSVLLSYLETQRRLLLPRSAIVQKVT